MTHLLLLDRPTDLTPSHLMWLVLALENQPRQV
jgi:hypothetical protein